MAITTCDHNLGLIGMVLRASYFDPLNNGNPFYPTKYPGPAPFNAIITSAQITEVVRLYRDEKEKCTTYYEFSMILIYTTTLKHRITNFFQCEPLAILAHLYTEYGTITSSDLTANFDLMKARWNPPTPIDNLFQQFNNGK